MPPFIAILLLSLEAGIGYLLCLRFQSMRESRKRRRAPRHLRRR